MSTGARIRVAGRRDAAALLSLKQRLDQETSFMLLEPGERDASVEKLAAELNDIARSGNSAVIVVESAGELAGYVQVSGGAFRRNRATGYLVIGVLAQVMAGNHRAIGLYERLGFTVEGCRVQCLLVGGRYIDELYMAAILPGEAP